MYVYGLVQNCPENIDIMTGPLQRGESEITDPRHRVLRRRFLVKSNEPSRLRLLLMYSYLMAWAFLGGAKSKYDAVVVNPGVVGNSLLALILKVMGVRVVGMGYAEEMTTVLKGAGLKARIKRFLMKRGYPRCDGFIVVCDFAKRLLEEMGVDGSKIAVIPPTLNAQKVRAQRNEVNDNHILSVGRLIKRKGFHYLIDAVSLVKKEVPDVRLTIVGGGPETKALSEQISKAGLEDSIELKGAVSDEELSDLYQNCALFVLANYMLPNGDCEGAPTVLIEASACGLPVIGGVEGGTSTVIDDGINGYLVDPQDVELFAQKIRSVLCDANLKNTMGRCGVEKVKRDHDPGTNGMAFSSCVAGFCESAKG